MRSTHQRSTRQGKPGPRQSAARSKGGNGRDSGSAARQTDPETNEAGSARYQLKKQVGHLLRRAYQRHVAIFQDGIPDSQLTTPQFVALCAVRDLGSCSLNDIVVETSIDQATIRGVVERISTRGLVAVSEDPSDKRKRSISLTAAGHEFLDQMIAVAEGITEKTFGPLNAAERVALVYLLEKMCASDSEM